MKIIKLSEEITKDLTEAKWDHRLHLKDIFRNFQSDKVDVKHARALIASRIAKFVAGAGISDKAKEALLALKKKISGEGDAIEIDNLVNQIYDIADANSILVK